jgi:hypothetical protein
MRYQPQARQPGWCRFRRVVGYSELLEAGQQYQDRVMAVLYRIGIVALCYSSKMNQYTQGESITGIEIKYDRKWRTSGNLYIETHERTTTDRPFVKSGILREDNTWLWAIGDDSKLFLIGKKQLLLAYRMGKYRTVVTATSKGFLLPVEDAEQYLAVRTVELQEGE